MGYTASTVPVKATPPPAVIRLTRSPTTNGWLRNCGGGPPPPGHVHAPGGSTHPRAAVAVPALALGAEAAALTALPDA